MPITAVGWTSEEEQELVELIKPHTLLYRTQEQSRNIILARQCTWKEIAAELAKPVEECKKRWKGLRDNYIRCKRHGLNHIKTSLYESLEFLDEGLMDPTIVKYINNLSEEPTIIGISRGQDTDSGENEQEVIVDNQEYYEVTFEDMDNSRISNMSKEVEVKRHTSEEPAIQIKKRKGGGGRKKTSPVVKSSTPVKILPKPILLSNGVTLNGQMNQTSLPRLAQLVQEPMNNQDSKSSSMDKLIEKVLSEQTNEIDIFFRSMATSVKKLNPNLIPKVKMEICNVIAKYELQDAELRN